LYEFDINLSKTTSFALNYRMRNKEVIKSGNEFDCAIFVDKMKEI